MTTILVINAGSSSLKFQLFDVEDGTPRRAIRGQMDGIGVHPRLRAIDGAGATLVDLEHEATSVLDLPTAIEATRAWFRTLEGVRIEEQLDDLTASIGAGDVSGYVQDAISFAQGAALSVILFLFSVVLVVVISIYMLLDMPRLERSMMYGG